MDQNTLFDLVIERIGAVSPLKAMPIEAELAKPKSFLKLVDAEHYNWSSNEFRKVFGMRFRVKVPPLDQLNILVVGDRATVWPQLAALGYPLIELTVDGTPVTDAKQRP